MSELRPVDEGRPLQGAKTSTMFQQVEDTLSREVTFREVTTTQFGWSTMCGSCGVPAQASPTGSSGGGKYNMVGCTFGDDVSCFEALPSEATQVEVEVETRTSDSLLCSVGCDPSCGGRGDRVKEESKSLTPNRPIVRDASRRPESLLKRAGPAPSGAQRQRPLLVNMLSSETVCSKVAPNFPISTPAAANLAAQQDVAAAHALLQAVPLAKLQGGWLQERLELFRTSASS
eukprot:TRINITY_DN27495_c0_g4_i2.p1 TRINITY_DN27495_c0_g4~~TRINITY_DN27495_c0_g4_i2.p1  ORF type:complete len:231 (-),score=41.89 TRINITY_DN27495_c0_g4_i2:263-955(-)